MNSKSTNSDRIVSYEGNLLREIMSELDPDNEQLTVEDQDFSQEMLEELPSDIPSLDHPDIEGERLIITSAIPLSRAEKERIVRAFLRITKQPIISLIAIVDPSLLIGIRVQSQRFYYEISGYQILHDLKKHIKLVDTEEELV